MIEKGGYIRDILAKPAGTQVEAYGWVKTRRDSKGVHFVQMNDGSLLRRPAGRHRGRRRSRRRCWREVTTGACVRVAGELVASPGAGQAVELKAREIDVFGAADPATYPLQKKGHTMEFLREIAHLRPRTNTFGAVFRVRNALAYAIHQFFQERGFLYVHTPDHHRLRLRRAPARCSASRRST